MGQTPTLSQMCRAQEIMQMAKRCGRGREGEQKKMKMVNLFTFEYGKTKDGKENLSEHRSKKEKKKGSQVNIMDIHINPKI